MALSVRLALMFQLQVIELVVLAYVRPPVYVTDMEPCLPISSPVGIHCGKRKQSSKRISNCSPDIVHVEAPVFCRMPVHHTAAKAGLFWLEEPTNAVGTVK